MKRLFGTDGIRGAFGREPLDRDTIIALGRVLGRETAAGGSRDVVAAGDTRDSTPQLAQWLALGLAAEGARLRWAGVLPTGAVAWLAPRLGAALGVAISASHNPHPDNGIKVIGGDGFKLPDEAEARFEALLGRQIEATDPMDSSLAAAPLVVEPGLAALYEDGLLATLPGDAAQALAGLVLVLDLGHGAAITLAPALFRRAGAAVRTVGDRPDGTNINRGCGSTHPEALVDAVRRNGADLGLAFDGDADRVILVDEQGRVLDGDAILYAWATAMRRDGELVPPSIVATTMSNLGLEKALAVQGIGVERCDVGDRYVMEALRRGGLKLGGEQSGHVVRTDLSTTGDGLLTGLHLARLVAASGRPASDLFLGFRRYPQRLHNLRVTDKRPFAAMPRVATVAGEIERELGGDGRLVLRYSGTEPLARIMIEAAQQETVDRLVGRLAEAFAQEGVLAEGPRIESPRHA